MKNVHRYLPFLLLGLLTHFACKNKCDNNNFGIQSIEPAANPVGYEIFIACSGVSASTKVRFDEVEAASVRTAEGGLIAKIPSGIAGTVSLSIEEGDCSDSKSFDVLGTYPGNTPASPTTVIVPQNPGSYPGSITNEWKNVFDSDHYFNLVDVDGPNGTADGVIDDGSNEGHDSITFFNGNPISGTYDTKTNKVFMVIDRLAQIGGYKDTLTGSFIPHLSSSPPYPDSTYTMLLTSKRTGRQLVIWRFH